jgi:RimJ/RimL family protein N-acetyltransferase
MNPILTPRLSLREIRDNDLDFLSALLADPEVMRYWPKPLSRIEAQDWIVRQQTRYAKDGCGYWLAVDRVTNEPVGQAGVLMVEWDGSIKPALGYMIHRPFWRQGYAFEAAQASRDFIWDTLRQPVAYTLIRPENEPSLGVARKLGMTARPSIQHYGLEHIVFELRK